MPNFMTYRRIVLLLAALLLAGCEIPSLPPDPKVVAREAESKAIGAACRFAMRGIEDCYILNEKAIKNAMFEGWKDMDEYMREHKLEGQKTTAVKETPPSEEILDEKRSRRAAK
jgi:hypothetical protein